MVEKTVMFFGLALAFTFSISLLLIILKLRDKRSVSFLFLRSERTIKSLYLFSLAMLSESLSRLFSIFSKDAAPIFGTITLVLAITASIYLLKVMS